MDTHNLPLTPGSFGDVDPRDTHPVPGQQKPVYPPIEAPSEAIFDGGNPTVTGHQTGAGGTLEGDVRRASDGFQVNPPDREAVDEHRLDTEAGLEGDIRNKLDQDHRPI